MGIKKFNKAVATYNYELDDTYTFISLEELFSIAPNYAAFRIMGFYISRAGKFGDAPVAVIKNYLVNLPTHLLEQVKEIMATEEITDLINAGKCAFSIYEYYSKKFDVQCYSVIFLDVDDADDMKDKKLIILPSRVEIDSRIIQKAEEKEGKAPSKKTTSKKTTKSQKKNPVASEQEFMNITEEELDKFPFA